MAERKTHVRAHRRMTRSGTTAVREHDRRIADIRERKDRGEEISDEEEKLLAAAKEAEDE